MYGMIHLCVKGLVTETFGEDKWKQILAQSGIDEARDFMVFHKYDDAIVLALVGAAVEVLGAPLDLVLQLFGEYFFEYCLQHGYDKMLLTLGDSLETFIQNLDSLHALLAMSYKNLDAPSFRCTSDKDGNLKLHYYSVRVGLHPIVIGILKAVGEKLFHTAVDISVVSVGHVDQPNGKTLQHVVFDVKTTSTCGDDVSVNHGAVTEEELTELGLADEADTALPTIVTTPVEGERLRPLQDETLISPRTLTTLLPYHLVFDASMRISQCGVNIQRLSSGKVKPGSSMIGAFTLIHPVMEFTFENIQQFINAVYILELSDLLFQRRASVASVASPTTSRRVSPSSPASPVVSASSSSPDLTCAAAADANDATAKTDGAVGAVQTVAKTLVVKGQMVHMADVNQIIFIGSLRLTSLTELLECRVYLSDIPLYDVTRELVLLNQQRIAEIEVSKKLDETTAELKRTALALEKEKEKTDLLLHQMLPRRVADQLRDGRRVEAEKFETATILFSDIVTFTTISAAVQPIQVVRMLNHLYTEFDKATNLHQVYKVETIGDAYMVVGGVPEVSSDHAQRVADQGLDMVLAARQVPSPATGLPLQIRVGIHSGSVVAGVVGDKMPRYCLFGDTVNTASRMESHGMPGRIHCSSFSYEFLKNGDCRFVCRGPIDVKGKGKMVTYFLIGNTSVHLDKITEENRDFSDLHMRTDANADSCTDMRREMRTAAKSTLRQNTEDTILKALHEVDAGTSSAHHMSVNDPISRLIANGRTPSRSSTASDDRTPSNSGTPSRSKAASETISLRKQIEETSTAHQKLADFIAKGRDILNTLQQKDAELRQDNAVARENNAVTRENNAVTRENNAVARENNAVARENNAVTRENNAVARCSDAGTQLDADTKSLPSLTRRESDSGVCVLL